jgi:hypothetical protein
MIVNLFYWHEKLLSVTRNVAQKRAEAIALPTDLQSLNDIASCPAEAFAPKTTIKLLSAGRRYLKPISGLSRVHGKFPAAMTVTAGVSLDSLIGFQRATCVRFLLGSNTTITALYLGVGFRVHDRDEVPDQMS